VTAPLNLQHLVESLYVSFAYAEFGEVPDSLRGVGENGSIAKVKISEKTANDLLFRDLERLPPPFCIDDELNQVNVAAVEKIINFAAKKQTDVIFYTTPWHPVYFVAKIEANPVVQSCYAKFNALFQKLDAQYEHVHYLDHTRLDSFNGLTGYLGFYDSHHMTWENNQQMIFNMLPTIIRAYNHALGLRQNRIAQ
jgi:hypothetical protein